MCVKRDDKEFMVCVPAGKRSAQRAVVERMLGSWHTTPAEQPAPAGLDLLLHLPLKVNKRLCLYKGERRLRTENFWRP